MLTEVRLCASRARTSRADVRLAETIWAFSNVGSVRGRPQPRPQLRVRHTAGVSDSLRNLLAAPPDLPVTVGLVPLVEALRTGGVAVVQAPPGTGKTTLVPPAVAGVVAGRVVVTQPSRIAARAAARRLAHLLGEGLINPKTALLGVLILMYPTLAHKQ